MRASSLQGVVQVAAAALAIGVLAASQQVPRADAAGRPQAAAPHQRRPMTLLDLAAVPRVGDPQLSPDGRSLAFIVQSAEWNSRYVAHIWLQPVEGGSRVQLTHGAADERFPRWSPDGKAIAFASRGQLYVVPPSGGEPAVLTHHPAPLVIGPVASPNDVGFAWAADGTSIYFIAKDRPSAARARQGDLTVFEQTDFVQQHLWTLDLATRKERQVTRGDWSVVSFRLTRDGKHAVVLRSRTPLVIDHYASEVWLLDLATGAMTQVTNNSNYETEADLSPDGSQVYFITDANENLEDYYGPSLFIVPSSGGKPRRLSPSAPYAVEMAGWAPDGRSVLAIANMGIHSEIVRVDVATGVTTPLTNGEHQIPVWNIFPSAGRMAFLIDEPSRMGDAWTLPLAGGSPARVTGVYDSLDRDFSLPRQERISWKAEDGTPLEGVLYYPIGYERGRRYPLVVQLHGGPQLSDKFGYGAGVLVNYVPVLAAKGYAVFRPNYRGSAGYGPVFYRDIVGHYFNHMHLDVMSGVDELVRRGIADPDRLAVSGWSAGATLVNKLITFTPRFRAASSGAGVANWISMMAQTDVLTRRATWFQGTPWDKGANLDFFLQQSPIASISQVKTPTIFFAGERDTRDPKEQSMEMYHGLQQNHVPASLEIAADEPHDDSAWTVRHMLAKDNAELEWFEHYVMNRSYTPELAPDPLPDSR